MIVALVVVGACSDDSERLPAEPATTAPDLATTPSAPTSTTTTTTAAAIGREFESTLSYVVELPAEWVTDATLKGELWLDSMIGGDGEFFRSRVHDHPNRDPFVDSVPKFLPALKEAVVETAGLFPNEFGTNPTIDAAAIGGVAGYLIKPSADSLTPDTTTYIFEAPVHVGSRFIEFAVDKPHEAEIMDSLRWLPPPASWVHPEIQDQHDRTGRRALEDLFDAMAAGKWEIAARYLLSESEWPGPDIATLIGEYDPDGETLATSLANYCATALCDASFSIGDSQAISEAQQSFEVTFESDEGSVVEQLNVGWFENEAAVSSLPPPGTVGVAAAPIDLRVFGEPYPGDLAVLRYKSTQYHHAADRTWSLYLWHLVSTPEWVAGDSVIANSRSYGHGAVGTDGQRVVLAEDPASIVGAATPADAPLVFIADENSAVVRAVDPEGIQTTRLFDFTLREERVYAVDASTNRIVVQLGIGDSTALELYQFDPTNRTVGSLITRIEPDGYIGAGHLAPNGATIAATLDPSFYDQTQTVALLNSADGTVLHRWSLEGDDIIDSLDYDSRFILAHLQRGDIFVIDTTNGHTRRVTTQTVIRFR